MAKISIQQNPTFKQEVDIPRIGGKAEKVPFTFKFLNREQLAAHHQARADHAKDLSALIQRQDATAADVAKLDAEFQFGQLKTILVGWGFDDEFNDDNIRALVNESAATADVIATAFNGAYQKAREGN